MEDGRALREWRRTEGRLWCSSTFTDRVKAEMEVAAMEVGALCMVATHQRRVQPLRRFLEHVACSEVAGVGGDFGPFPCRIRRWAKNEVCSTLDTLQL